MKHPIASIAAPPHERPIKVRFVAGVHRHGDDPEHDADQSAWVDGDAVEFDCIHCEGVPLDLSKELLRRVREIQDVSTEPPDDVESFDFTNPPAGYEDDMAGLVFGCGTVDRDDETVYYPAIAWVTEVGLVTYDDDVPLWMFARVIDGAGKVMS